MSFCFFTVVEPGAWPEMDSQPLSLEDPWRLRIASAQAYSIMKNRAMEHFERVMDFVEASYRLAPELVDPMKQIKIMFGLKTMVWKEVMLEFIHFAFAIVHRRLCILTIIIYPYSALCFSYHPHTEYHVDAATGQRRH